MRIEQLLKNDKIEEALTALFNFIEVNQPYFKQKLPSSQFIVISASVSRLNNAFAIGIIDFELMNRERSKAVNGILAILDIFELDIKNIERRNEPRISGPPAIFRLSEQVSELELIINQFKKSR